MTLGRKRVQIDTVTFRRDVEQGTTVLVLAEKYGIAKSTVWRLKAEMSGKIARREPVDETTEVEAPEAFDITLNVPTERLDSLLGSPDIGLDELRGACLELDPQAKATLFQAVLQGRLERSFRPLGVELPNFNLAAPQEERE